MAYTHSPIHPSIHPFWVNQNLMILLAPVMWGHLWKDLPCLRSVVFLPCSTQLPKSEVPRRPRKDMWKAHQLKSQWPSTQLINQSPTLRYMSQQILFLHLENECNMGWKSLQRPFRIQEWYNFCLAHLFHSRHHLQGHSRISYHWRLYFPSKSYLLHQKNLSATRLWPSMKSWLVKTTGMLVMFLGNSVVANLQFDLNENPSFKDLIKPAPLKLEAKVWQWGSTIPLARD